MEKIVHSLIFISLLIASGANAAPVHIYDPSVTVLPNQPTTQDTVIAELAGDLAMTGYSLDGTPSVMVNGSDIIVDFALLSGPGAFVITPFTVDIEIGLLDAGSYQLTANFIVDGDLQHALHEVFEVTVIPLPAASWLFASGLLGLFAMRRNCNRV